MDDKRGETPSRSKWAWPMVALLSVLALLALGGAVLVLGDPPSIKIDRLAALPTDALGELKDFRQAVFVAAVDSERSRQALAQLKAERDRAIKDHKGALSSLKATEKAKISAEKSGNGALISEAGTAFGWSKQQEREYSARVDLTRAQYREGEAKLALMEKKEALRQAELGLQEARLLEAYQATNSKKIKVEDYSKVVAKRQKVLESSEIKLGEARDKVAQAEVALKAVQALSHPKGT